MRFYLFFFSIIIISNPSFSKSKGIGSIIYTKGKVWVDGKLSKKNIVLINGQTVKTGPKGLTILRINGGSTLKLQPNSSLKVNHRIMKNKKRTLLNLIKGSLFTKFNKNKKSSLKVMTKTASLGVRGTEFFTSYGKKDSDDLWMCVKKGKVAIRGKDEKKSTMVKAGEGVVVKKRKTSFNTSEPKAG